jgi:alkanesulfonate monooxygenase SsuD/methylene tetrahydromethanopterin reductase-like flavin-dependent oxidoreductase (luciferase family)
MAKKTEFGVRLPVGGPLASVEAVNRVADRAETWGFDALWVHDFIVWTRMQDRTHLSCGSREVVSDDQVPIFYESLTNLAYLAGITKRPKLGVAVLCLPYRNPVIAARQITNIDHYSNGRLILGIGPGGNKSGNNRDFEVLGVPRKDKYERTKDYLRAMIAVWTQDVSSYEGPFFSFSEAEFFPKPVQQPYPAIWGGGWAARSIEIVAEFCTGWVPGWVAAEDYPAKIEEIRELAVQKGRGNVEFDIATEIFVCVDRSHEAAYEKSKLTMEALPHGFQTNPEESRIRRSSLIGSTEEVAEAVRRFVDSGVTHFEMKFIYQSIDHLVDQLHLFHEEIMPAYAPVAT